MVFSSLGLRLCQSPTMTMAAWQFCGGGMVCGTTNGDEYGNDVEAGEGVVQSVA